MTNSWAGGKIVYALDGLFGLPRKKSAGVSYRPAVQGALFFCNQEAVDEFVAEASVGKQVAQVVLTTLLPLLNLLNFVSSFSLCNEMMYCTFLLLQLCHMYIHVCCLLFAGVQ